MANTVKTVHKNFFKHLYPEVADLTLILKTDARIYYAWKNGQCIKYDYVKDTNQNLFSGSIEQYYKEYVCKGIKNPFTIVQHNGYWSTDMLVIRDFGDYLGIIQPRCQTLKVTEFKRSEKASKILVSYTYGHSIREFRVYKNRKTLLVNYSTSSDEQSYFGYMINPKYQAESRWEGSRWGFYDFSNLHNGHNLEQWNKQDKNGNYKWLSFDHTDDLSIYAEKPSLNHTMGWTASSFYNVDFRKCWAKPITLTNHNSEDNLKLDERTIQIITNFFSDLDPELKNYFTSKYNVTRIETMEQLCKLITCPDVAIATRQLTKKRTEEAIFDKLCKQLQWNRVHRGLVFDRVDNKIYVSCYRIGTSDPCYWRRPNSGIAILVYDVLKKTKKLYVKRQNEQLSIPVPSEERILEWFDVSPHRIIRRYTFNNNNPEEFEPEASIIWVKPITEIFAGTNLELFLNLCPADLQINYRIISGEREEHQHYNITRISQLFNEHTFRGYAWKVFLSTKDCIAEQLLKSNLLYLFMAYLHGKYFHNLDERDNSRWGMRIGFHSKAKSLKKCFDLSMKQLKLVDEHIKKRYPIYTDGVSYYAHHQPPIIPSILGLSEVFNIDVRGIDLETFNKLLALSDQPQGEYEYFTWTKFFDYHALLTVTRSMSPGEIFDWLSRGYNLELYNDYLKMRAKLQRISIDMDRPDLFNEKAYPIKVKDPTDVRRLHDLCEKITFQYQNTAKAKMFDSAIAEAKKFEWEDSEKETNRMRITAPSTISDLVYEGTELHHCVKSPMWIDAIAERSSVILLIRRCDAKDVPFFTVELNPKGEIRQCHGLSNCNPTQEVINFLHRWAKAKKSIVSEASIVGSYRAYCAPR